MINAKVIGSLKPVLHFNSVSDAFDNAGLKRE